MKTVKVNGYLSEQDHRKLRVIAVEAGTTIANIVSAAVKDMLKSKPQLARSLEPDKRRAN